ncbi:Do family serine endopeptidase [Lichenihabitans psoromatis]|uniref:Do family serine endopeptidase n=1 Tax=Lichenihabitans psoromatis TaxID=2528642 RepID=UPI00103857BA|nr:Do family serine endopeptidase [Lichenihabitans psoromatis]
MKSLTSRRAALVVLAFVGSFGGAAADDLRTVPQARSDVLMSFSPVVKKAQPSVVNVYASRTDRQARNPLFDDPVFQQFFGGGRSTPRPGGPTAQSLGSGVIVDSSGLVVTNYHVIDTMTDVKVALSDKREVAADIVLRDKRTDLAILKLKTGGPFQSMDLGDSDALEVGDLVLAIGDPFGVGQTVTQGIVSGLARTQVGGSDYQFFVQTDAAINPGNSGGALVDMHGRLIGINSAIYSQSGGSVGIGFAIPVNLVKTVIESAKAGAHDVRRPWLGATLQVMSRDIADTLGLDRPTGALVASVLDDGPAKDAGLRSGDIVMAVDGQSIDDPDGFGYRFATKAIGSVTSLTVSRGGKTIIVPIKLTTAPEVPPREVIKLKNRSPFSGATVVNFSPAVAEELSIQGVHDGVVVADVDPGSNAAEAGLAKGDVILGLENDQITSTKQLERATNLNRSYYHLTLSRGGQVVQTEIGG